MSYQSLTLFEWLERLRIFDLMKKQKIFSLIPLLLLQDFYVTHG